MSETMRAVVVRGPMHFGVERVPVPAAPPGGLLLRVVACGLCGSDLRTLRSGHRNITLPRTIGHEVAGRVAATGAGYAGPWQVGDLLAVGPLVYCGHCDFCADGRFELCENQRELGQHWPGGLAEYIAIPEESVRLGNILPVPPGLDPAHAAISEPISSCVNAQELAQVGLGDTVAIIGSGPIGCIHTSLARARGAGRIFLIDISAERLALAQPFGPDAVLDATQTDTVAAIRELTGGRGPEVVITATPAPVASVQAVEMARKGGRILIFGGLPHGDSKPGVDMNLVHYKALKVMGITTFAPRHQRQALGLMATGRMPVEKLVTHRLPLDAFAQGVELAMAGQALKVVFEP